MVDKLNVDFSIPLSVPQIKGNELKYVQESISAGWISSVGPFVDRFEKEFAEKIKAPFAIAVTSGTAALQLALQVVGVKAGDDVFVPTLTFIATANAVHYNGARPVFIDCDEYMQMSPQHLREVIQTHYDWDGQALKHKISGRKATAMVPTHLLGHVCDMDSLNVLAREYNLLVVEDACESLGATYKGRPVGNFSQAAAFSFNGNKIISTGGGGMMSFQEPSLAKRARYLSTQAKDNPIEYVHHEIGYNFRMTNVLAAIGCAQLEQLDSYIAKKRQIVAMYADLLTQIRGFSLMPTPPWCESTFWLYTAIVDHEVFGMTAREIVYTLMKKGIQTRPLWEPNHMSKAYKDLSFATTCPRAERFHRQALSLPCSVGITEKEIKVVCAELKNLVKS